MRGRKYYEAGQAETAWQFRRSHVYSKLPSCSANRGTSAPLFIYCKCHSSNEYQRRGNPQLHSCKYSIGISLLHHPDFVESLVEQPNVLEPQGRATCPQPATKPGLVTTTHSHAPALLLSITRNHLDSIPSRHILLTESMKWALASVRLPPYACMFTSLRPIYISVFKNKPFFCLES